jgi:hypothetical protein
VGLGGLEPPASSLSGMRSNHLSYRPLPRTTREESLYRLAAAIPNRGTPAHRKRLLAFGQGDFRAADQV